MATFRFAVEKRPTRSKQYNIYLFVTIAGKTNRRKTGVVIDHLDDFNYNAKQNNWIRSRVLNAKSLNDQLRLIIEEARETFNTMEREGEVTATGLLNTMKKETVSPSFFQFAKDRAKALKEEGHLNNAKKYQNLVNKLEAFMKKQRLSDIKMEDINVELLEKFKNYLHKWKNQKEKDKLLHPNAIAVQFTVFKTLINQAIKMDLFPSDKNPFLKFSYKGKPTQKEKLDYEEMQKIIDLDLTTGSLLWNVRNSFLFSFYCAGIRIGDLLQLRWNNITKDGRLHYTMDKNSKPKDIVLVPQALDILEQYKSDDINPTHYIFPFLNINEKYARYADSSDYATMPLEIKMDLANAISNKTALLNKYLKIIAKKAEISKNLTNHMARHSFAKIAAENKVETKIIQELLAHSNLATTEHYMGNFDKEKTDNALIQMFGEKKKDKKEEIIEMLKSLSPEEIAEIMKSIDNQTSEKI